MPSRLRRIYGLRDFHFITCSCYRRQPLLGTRHAREVFLRIFEQVRRKYQFEVVGDVVMPEHFHILIAEPEKGNPSTVLQVLKQSLAHRLLKPSRKRRSNPLNRGLVPSPELWRWSSFRAYFCEEASIVRIDELDAIRKRKPNLK